MSLVLTSADRALLRPALGVLSAPLEAVSIDAWRTAVLRALLPLFSADSAAFVLACEGSSSASLLNLPERYLGDYLEHQAHDDRHYLRVEAGAFTTESITGGDYRVFEGNPLFSGVYQPYRIREGVGIVLGPSDKPIPIGPNKVFQPAGINVEGVLALYADRRGRQRFQTDGFLLMELLTPMVQSAAQLWSRLSDSRRNLARIVDAVSEGIAIYDPTGKLLHINSRLASMLAEDSEALLLQSAIAEQARAITPTLLSAGEFGDYVPKAFSRQFVTHAAQYRIRASVAETALAMNGAILVHVDRLTIDLPSEQDLKSHFRFTSAEAKVVKQLCRGTSPQEIATLLRVSIHTVRRHIEHSRSKVGAGTISEMVTTVLTRKAGGRRRE